MTMTQKEIRDQIENLIRMNQISEEITNPLVSKSIDLFPVLSHHYSSEALETINKNKVSSLLVQWNRPISNYQYFGEQACSLANLLEKIGIESHYALRDSNYVREVSRVYFYGLTCQRNEVADASMRLINMFNDLSSKKVIRGVLTPLLSVRLTDDRIVVVTYIAIDDQNKSIVDPMYGSLEFKEGAIPPEFK